jgi:hypothetical protein
MTFLSDSETDIGSGPVKLTFKLRKAGRSLMADQSADFPGLLAEQVENVG